MKSQALAGTKPTRWVTEARLRVILLTSLALNLFLGGYWLGGILGRSLHPPGFEAGRLTTISERLRGKLSADGMLKIDALVVDIETMLNDRSPSVENARAQLRDVVSASEFDRQNFLSVVDSLSIARSTTDRAIADRIASTLAQLSLQDRRILTEVVLSTTLSRPAPQKR